MDGRTKKFVEVALLIPKGYPIVISYDCVGFDSSFYEQSLSLSHPYRQKLWAKDSKVQSGTFNTNTNLKQLKIIETLKHTNFMIPSFLYRAFHFSKRPPPSLPLTPSLPSSCHMWRSYLQQRSASPPCLLYSSVYLDFLHATVWDS